MKMMVAAVALLGSIVGARAQTPPQYVKGPLSGFEFECKEGGQRLDVRAFVSSLDLDGDGKPDFIFDIAKGCTASKLLFCNEAEGCLIDVYLSGVEMKQLGVKVRAFKPGKRDGKTALLLTMAGPGCGKAPSPCEKALVWTGVDLEFR